MVLHGRSDRVAAPWLRHGRRSRRLVSHASVIILALLGVLLPASPGRAQSSPNVVIVMSDDQRWDKVTPEYMPRTWNRIIQAPSSAWGRAHFPRATSVSFANAFVPNPLCCPSRASTLTGNHSHTTGVWNNGGVHGGFTAFDDSSTLATDFSAAGYETAMIGKYLNGYQAGTNTYIPPGWDRWFAVDTGSFYNYEATTTTGPRKFGKAPEDYIAEVLKNEAISFVSEAAAGGTPFFLYLSFTAPHGPAKPDPRDVGRFPIAEPVSFQNSKFDSQDMLESGYSMDRAIGNLMKVMPENTIVVFMGDNGYLWNEEKGPHGPLRGKMWPFDESARIPMAIASLDGTFRPPLAGDELVLNIDLRPTLTAAAGVPSVPVEGLDWGGGVARTSFVLERFGAKAVPSYCGVRELTWMYVRWANGIEELYNDYAGSFTEQVNLAADPAYAPDLDRLKRLAMDLCGSAPPGYTWA